MHHLHRYALGAAFVIVFSIAGCITLPGTTGTQIKTLPPPTQTEIRTTSAPYTDTPVAITPSPTSSPTITPTQTPTPTITPTPTETSIPGWAVVEGSGVSLWLPEVWRGGNPQADLDQLLADAVGTPEIRQYAEILEENRSTLNLWAFDTSSIGSFHVTNVNIGQENVGGGVSVDQYMDAIDRNLPEGFTITGRELLEIQSRQGGRIYIDVNFNGLRIGEVMYIFKDADLMWLVTFAADADSFEAQLPVIELSMQTIEFGEAERE